MNPNGYKIQEPTPDLNFQVLGLKPSGNFSKDRVKSPQIKSQIRQKIIGILCILCLEAKKKITESKINVQIDAASQKEVGPF